MKNTKIKEVYRRKHLQGLPAPEGESMRIMVRSMAIGRHGAGVCPTLTLEAERGLTGEDIGF